MPLGSLKGEERKLNGTTETCIRPSIAMQMSSPLIFCSVLLSQVLSFWSDKTKVLDYLMWIQVNNWGLTQEFDSPPSRVELVVGPHERGNMVS